MGAFQALLDERARVKWYFKSGIASWWYKMDAEDIHT